MAIYRCSVCGYVFDEEKEGKSFADLKECPVCHQPAGVFRKQEETKAAANAPAPAQDNLAEFAREDESIRYMKEIHQMARTGKPLSAAMGTQVPLPAWEDILLLGAQLSSQPLLDDAPVSTQTVIGKHAKQPLVLESPVYISHMSFGALSREAKIALAKGASMAGTAACSGEGGVLPEEMAAADRYIFEYVANRYSVTPELLQAAGAIEIKIGQSAKPGMGGHLPGEKVTPEIARIRGRAVGQDIHAPSRFEDINTKEELRDLVEQLRYASHGRPIGIKIAAGHIEEDLEWCVFAKPDFITLDGRGGGTGSAPQMLRDGAGVPTIYALYRARECLNQLGADIDLVITGGLRVSADFAKAIAMGADAIAVATGALLALGCQQYRICGSGNCPMGIATQNPQLSQRLDMNAAAQRVANYLKVCNEELKMFARITGHSDIHQLSVHDLITTSREISEFTNIPHA